MNSPNIPVLDHSFNMRELVTVLKSIKPNKAVDLNGNYPGIYCHLPTGLLIFILNVFDMILNYFKIPNNCNISKLFVLFKKEKTHVVIILYMLYICYIYVIYCICYILYIRLNLWYQPGRSTERA